MKESEYKLNLTGAYVELTTACNGACPYCYNDSGKNSVFLEETIIKNIIQELSDQSLSTIAFSGGEPFLHPKINDLISYAEQRNVKPIIISNFMLLTESELNRLLERRLDLQITFDNVNEIKHDAIRGKGNYKKIVSLIKLAQEKNVIEKLHIRFNLSKSNHQQITDFIAFLKIYGVKKATISFLHKSGRGKTYDDVFDYKYDVELISSILENLGQIENEIGESFSLTYGELNKNFGCAFFANGAIDCLPRIDPDGNVYLCQLFTGDPNILGSVRSLTLSEILKSEQCLGVTQNIRDRQKKLENCVYCQYETICMGGCPAVAYNDTLDLYAHDDQCKMIKYSMKNILLDSRNAK